MSGCGALGAIDWFINDDDNELIKSCLLLADEWIDEQKKEDR